MTNRDAWASFYGRIYTADFVNLSDLLGSDWASHLPVNKTAGQYSGEAYRRMIATYGEEE